MPLSKFFSYADKTTALSLPNEMGLKLQFMLDYTNKGRKLMVVPDNQMEDFIAFVGVADDTFRMEDDLLYVKGDKIIVTSGVMKGLTGELVKVGREDRILVRLDGVLACSMVMSSDMFEKIYE